MKFKLNDCRVHIPFQPTAIRWTGDSFFQDRHEQPLYDPCYRGFREACNEICNLLDHIRTGAVNGQQASAPTQGGIFNYISYSRTFFLAGCSKSGYGCTETYYMGMLEL